MEITGVRSGVGRLVEMCIEAATAGAGSVERWRRQRRTLERLPSHLADAIVRRLQHRRLLYPSLLEIFQHSVEEIELKGESCVDAEWMTYLGGFRHLRILNVGECRGINNSALWAITGMNSLKELDLSRCSKVTNAGIRHLLSIASLEKLCISETGVTADGVMLISSLRNLQVLDMGGLPVTDMALFSLQVLTHLKHLDLWGSKISDNGAALLEMFPRLSFLNLAWTSVTKLPNLPCLKCLNMSNCVIHSISLVDTGAHGSLSKLIVPGATFLDSDGFFSNLEGSYMKFLDVSASSIRNFCFIDNMNALEHLDLSFCAITDDLLQHVAHIGEHLRFLNLNSTKITSNGLSTLIGSLLNLQTLSLSCTEIDDTSLPYISLFPSLRVLDLSHTYIKGFTYWNKDCQDKSYSLSALQNLIHLESLNLEDTKVRDEAVHPLSCLRELKYLYLKSDFLSDISLHILACLSKLKFLGFRGTVLTNSGLRLYLPKSVLDTLDLRGCWLLTEDVLLSFCKMHPKIEVRHEHIQTIETNRNVRVVSSPFHRTASPSQFRRKGGRSFQTPGKYEETIFLDERIKYDRQELLELQHSSILAHTCFDADIIPGILRRE